MRYPEDFEQDEERIKEWEEQVSDTQRLTRGWTDEMRREASSILAKHLEIWFWRGFYTGALVGALMLGLMVLGMRV